MLKTDFALFILRNRFNLRDIFPSVSNGTTRQEFELSRCFHPHQIMGWHFGDGKLAELNLAFTVAQYMSNNGIDQPEGLSQYTSKLSDEGWAFALRFSPYHKVHIALENLQRVHSAMLEACLSLNAAMAGMESAYELHGSDRSVYIRERSKATSSLLTFSALYASYIDVCYRIRDYSGLKESNAYPRAVKRILGRNSGEHSFAKGLRNFILHYHLVEPEITISWRSERTVRLLLDANSLLFAGFNWAKDARSYLQSNEKLDVMAVTSTVIRDVARLVRFHQKIAEKRLCRSKLAYDTYVHERIRFHHLQKSVINLGAAFRRPTTVLSRVLDESVVLLALNSTMREDDVRNVLTALADRHRNLSADTKEAVAREIEELLATRPRLPNKGAFLGGRERN
ncbi:hypothetical protein [Sulfitobacter dubius]|uniref:Uncharacterized protein n=1 Tax=Sulfitobacter dubius TaxID=218673 RepID=A0ABY3ZHC3_9RHOB|nr:hypothetical protein [Sulfitobacter dubius]UOA14035.1 hypothetical protein DSM109990_00830 [Sulfitobacter dubius]